MESGISPEAQRGRCLLAIAIVITLIGDLAIVLLKILRLGVQVSAGSAARWIITAALLYAVWVGLRWARWLMVTLLGLGLVMVVPVMLSSLDPLAVGIALQFAVAAALLAFPRSVSRFLEYQRHRYSGKDQQSGRHDSSE
jgi:hypothetical protein